MRNELKITAVSIVIFLLMTVSLVGALSTSEKIDEELGITEVTCSVGDETTTTYLSVDTIKSVVTLGESHKDDFMTIYNKYSTVQQVEEAFGNLQPFFETLVSTKLTTHSVDELNDLFHMIRSKIRKPKVNPFAEGNGPRPLGNWNGIPTPIFGNAGCGLFNVGIMAIGFTLGTHTILPTIGVDLMTTWFDFGSTETLGLLGFTTSQGPHFGFILGFIGIMIATPIMILGIIFQTGFAGTYMGISPSPI
jgi:hypothetical protein